MFALVNQHISTVLIYSMYVHTYAYMYVCALRTMSIKVSNVTYLDSHHSGCRYLGEIVSCE